MPSRAFWQSNAAPANTAHLILLEEDDARTLERASDQSERVLRARTVRIVPDRLKQQLPIDAVEIGLHVDIVTMIGWSALTVIG
jgi:hypothetical protein